MTPLFDTVTAIATPPGKGGVAVIRVSGPDAVGITSRCFRPRCGKPLAEIPERHAVYGGILADGEEIDDGIAVVFHAPRSYTGEDTVELSCHGSPLLQSMILEALLSAGAVMAPAGEFTRRAFLSGKISLSDAEAIGSALDAVTGEQIRLSAAPSRSLLSRSSKGIHDRLLTLVSSLYARLDYPDEDLADIPEEEIIRQLREIHALLDSLCRSYKTGRAIRDGIPTVLAGKPNVGKSSVYNRLLGEDAAIVTSVPGTTRDILERPLPLGRVLLRLADTAGIRATDDPVEKIGVSRSRERLAGSELILAVLDRSAPLDGEDRELLQLIRELSGTPVLLLNKNDLPPLWGEEDLPEGFPYVISCSAEDGAGFAELTALVDRLFTDQSIRVGESPIVTTARQSAAVRIARDGVAEALSAFSSGMPTDAAASTLETALSALSELDGRSVSGEIVSSIFSRFCVGK